MMSRDEDAVVWKYDVKDLVDPIIYTVFSLGFHLPCRYTVLHWKHV